MNHKVFLFAVLFTILVGCSSDRDDTALVQASNGAASISGEAGDDTINLDVAIGGSVAGGGNSDTLNFADIAGGQTATLTSTAAVNQVVQPRFEPPTSVNASRLTSQLAADASCAASIARAALLTIGSSNGHSGSCVFRYWSKSPLLASSHDSPSFIFAFPPPGWVQSWACE